MKCVVISDTHGMYRQVVIPDGDVFIHAGDITRRGSLSEMEDFNDWLGELPHKHKVIIAGNHDWCFERTNEEARAILINGTYLQDESVIIGGIKFYGSPWQPEFYNWAFNLPRGDDLKEKWDFIPNDVDVLITHGPRFGVLDEVLSGERTGCNELLKVVDNIQPKFHVFGHIHEAYGMVKGSSICSINASTATVRYEPINPAIVFDI